MEIHVCRSRKAEKGVGKINMCKHCFTLKFNTTFQLAVINYMDRLAFR